MAADRGQAAIPVGDSDPPLDRVEIPQSGERFGCAKHALERASVAGPEQRV